jgi:glutaminyl-tRNA synthetase
VRLRYAYFIKCTDVIKDANGNIVELRCTYDPETRGGNAPDGRKVKTTLHWVSAAHALPAQARLYEHLFTRKDPEDVPEGSSWRDNINPNSVAIVDTCLAEPSLATAQPGERYQFERVGYFCVDPDSAKGKLVFNRTVSLKDEWARMQKANK